MNRHFFAGMKTASAAAISLIPLGISVGLVAAQAGLRWYEAGLMSALVMVGSAEIMAMGMLIQGAPIYLILLSTFFMSLKNLIFCGSAMQRIGPVSLPRRLLCSFAMSDLGVSVYSMAEERSDSFLLGINTLLCLCFFVSTCAGGLMTGALSPAVTNSLGIALYALFLSLIVPAASKNFRLLLLMVFTAALNWAMQQFMSSAWSLVIAMIVGAFIGVFFVDLDGDKKTPAPKDVSR